MKPLGKSREDDERIRLGLEMLEDGASWAEIAAATDLTPSYCADMLPRVLRECPPKLTGAEPETQP